MLLLLLMVLAAEPSKLRDDPPPPPEEELFAITPVQGDVSFSFGLADRTPHPLAGALYLGGALGWTNEQRPAFFAGLGFELTYTAYDDPYRISLGAQFRLGLAWAQRRGHTSTAIPDLLLYLRVTPFGGGLARTTTTIAGMPVTSSSTYFGVRAGVGLTSLWPARQYFEHTPFFDIDGIAGDFLEVLTTLVLFPMVLLSHGEIAFEYVFSPAPQAAVLFRVGAGF